jgi:ParB family chromosome partitioning protein
MTTQLPAFTGTATEHYIADLDIDVVAASKTNPRKHFDPLYIEELSHSIRDKGVMQPIIVRQVAGQKKVEIVAGECRYRASKAAGKTTIPVIARIYTDEQVLELQLIENIHRKDLTPLEQAVGYRKLIDSNPTKFSAETIAQRIGMSVAWVWDRLKLNDLIPEAKHLLEIEKISIGHAILIARQKPEHQKRIINPNDDLLFESDDHMLPIPAEERAAAGKWANLKPLSIRELENNIAEKIRFDVAHAGKAVPLQFEEVAVKVDTALQQPGRGKKVIQITFDHRASDAVRNDGTDERVFGKESWRLADGSSSSAKRCDHSVLGVVTAGVKNNGRTFEVCVNRDKCLVHYGDVVRQREKSRKLRDSGQPKKAEKSEATAKARKDKTREELAVAARHWNGLVNRLRPAIAKHLAGTKLTAKLLLQAVDDNADFYEVSEIAEQYGLKFTDATMGQVIALLAVDLREAEEKPNDWDSASSYDSAKMCRDSFLKSAKTIKFNPGAIEQKYNAELKAAADKAAKK